MCISISYYKLENNSQCRFIMDLINKNNSNTEQSYEFQQAVNSFYLYYKIDMVKHKI